MGQAVPVQSRYPLHSRVDYAPISRKEVHDGGYIPT
jgi:hypothetical protein